MPRARSSLGVGSGTHAGQTARVMEALERVVTDEPPDLAFVPGDVNSTLGAALVFAKLGIPYAHIESGLRSFDRSMPEEINRIVADEFGSLLFAHSDEAVANLAAEGSGASRVHLVGQHDDRLTRPLSKRVSGRSQAATQTRPRTGGLPAGDAPPTVARRRRRASRSCCEQLTRVAARAPGRLSGASRERSRGSTRSAIHACGSCRRSGISSSFRSRAKRVPFSRTREASRRRRRISAYPVLHAAEHDGAPGDHPTGHEHAPRARAGARRFDPRPARPAACGRRRAPSSLGRSRVAANRRRDLALPGVSLRSSMLRARTMPDWANTP